MWNRFMKRLEIIGYSRAIGAMTVHGLRKEALVCEASRLEAIKELEVMKAAARRNPSKTYMRGTANPA